MQLFSRRRRRITLGLSGLGIIGFLGVGLFWFIPSSAAAVDSAPIVAGELAAGSAEGGCTAGGPSPVPCPQKGIKQSLEVVGEKIFSPAFRIALIQALLNLSQFVLNRLAYEAAVAIASGGPGEDSLFYNQTPSEAFGQLGLEVAGEAIGSLSELSSSQLGIEFNLCQPSQTLQLALALGIKQKYQPTAPKCDFMEIISNWESFGADLYQRYLDPEGRQEAILGAFASALKPGQNELTATLRINIAIDQKIHEQKLLQFLERNESTYKNVTDFITGNIETPAETLQADFEEALKKSKDTGEQVRVGEIANAGELIGGLALSTASTFTNVLLSKLLDRIYTGLFDTEIVDPFDVEAVGSGDKEAAQERFASIIATNPIATQEYDALSEFVVCTAEGTINRTLNSCVMDVNFLAAVNRGTAGQPMTIQEAIDEGLLSGDWPLIPPDNEAANQDPFCYTYGYCYGNLVKLRKARVIPIGWELAAGRNSESNPATLQEIIDNFDNCTQEGTIGPAGASDSESKWCHLIDPNWVLKYPKTECRAVGNGEIRISTLSSGRNTECVDAPSCIGEDNDGNCVDGYGYCTQERNVWRFRGEECPEEYATCLSFTNAFSGESGDFLVSTVDYSVCDQDNAGCRWYRTNKYVEDAGTDDTDDDSYEWLADGDDYVVAERDADMNYWDGVGAVGRTSYSYTSDSGETYTYEQYAYEDRLYLTNDAVECGEDDAGCTQMYAFDESLYLNTVRNASFEDDEDADGTPDGWTPLSASGYTLDTSTSEFGSTSLSYSAGLLNYLYQDVSASENNFYTFSTYFKAQSSGDSGVGLIIFLDEDGNSISAAGSSYSGDCEWNSTFNWYQLIEEADTTDFERFECLVTAPAGTTHIRVGVGNSSIYSSSPVSIDAVQLELGEDANIFAEGYSGTLIPVYYQIAPDYLDCTGSETDPEECDAYAQVCSAQDVGCNLYTPEDADPSVPAIISELDECPSECVGYTTYKQEATDYESEEFPLYFIADSASSCSEQYVGCDSYTNLGAVEAGGEGVEYYTDLRFCLSTDIADSSAANKTPATYFTWEGSDNAGYQLQTWYLLQSNYTGTKDTFDNCSGSGCTPFEETAPSLAPCTHVQMNSENEVVCRDTNALMQIDVWANEDCDEHSDIFENPDCREFFDTEGNIHYRQYSDTISISDECAAYRKDDGNETDCDDSGGWWTDQGFCRYYVLSEESTECPAEQNGCREYTGGSGRNATTILDETFEGGTYEDFVMADLSNFPDEISISNESVATEGHSLYVLAPSSGIAGIETVQISNSTTYDEDDSTTCDGTVGDTGCELTNDVDGDGSDDEDCVVADGEDSCGALTGSVVAGKTFVLEFWAKGTGDLYVTFEEEGGTAHDFVDPTATISSTSDLTPVALDGSWALYSLGPVDTTSDGYEDFDENVVIRFATDAGNEFYLDNISLKQTQENVTLIKDSWVVPSTCDQTPEGVDSDQYYLGCEAYTDQNDNDVNLYQFSDLCSEELVGCEGFYQTSQSESPYTQIYNARCVYSTDTDLVDGEVVGSNTTCEVDGIEYCTISAGEGFCTFDTDQAFSGELPVEAVSSSLYYAVVFGPETVVVSGDTPVYIVADDNYACTASMMGCEELGQPTYAQDQSEVESFESVYYINLPENYDTILCDNEALFCEEWESTQDGNFYFKDPLDKECEYKTSVTIDSRAYYGWFRTGTTQPCYWTDEDDDGAFDYGEEDAYLIAGEEFGAWNNGDDDYDSWVAVCDAKYDLCTEFIDVVDTGGGLNDNGQSYYFTNDELLDEETLTDNQRCNGQVSQKFGCALFNNTTVSELSYNASASYVLSTHADVFYGTEKNDLVDPISCTTEDGGVFEISEGDAAQAGTDTTIDLCSNRCSYSLALDDSLTTDYADQSGLLRWFERSCFVDSDCPVLTTYEGEEVSGTCQDTEDLTYTASYGSAEDYYLADDTNEVLKVNRDRTCAAWLACETTRTSWNTSTNKYDSICDSLIMCVEGSQQGDQASCQQIEDTSPVVLSDYMYSARDVSWSGFEYAGYSIPNQLPIQYYDQFNINPSSRCEEPDGTGIENDLGENFVCSSFEDCDTDSSSGSCTSDSYCTDLGYGGCDQDSGTCFYACNEVEADYRLVYNAGPCDSSETEGVGQGGECSVGVCEDSGYACSSDDDCATGDSCIVGYLQATGTENCVNEDCSCNPNENDENDGTNADCSGVSSSTGVSTPTCDPQQFVCVDEFEIENREACIEDSSTHACIATASAVVGSCFNNRCLALIGDFDDDGAHAVDPFSISKSREAACRSYPEIDSPYAPDIVVSWATYTDDGSGLPDVSDLSLDISSSTTNLQIWSYPYDFINGYQDSTVCSPDENGAVSDDCLCSYDKVEYGEGVYTRYITPSSGNTVDTWSTQVTYDNVPDAVCVTGSFKGAPCQTNDDCSISTTDSGLCERVDRQDTYYGWSGYCLEKDTSIQINGSTDPEDRACLTWLPVDQLSGATDLYGKYTQAGYELANTYYCADVTLAYDIQTSSVMCAESQGVDGCVGGSGWSDFIDDIEDDGGCLGAVTCPNGYFAVMTGCNELTYDESGSATSDTNDDDPVCKETSGDADCPFFCVPKGSYKSEDDEITGIEDASTIGTACLPPEVGDNPFDRPNNKSWTYSQIAGWGERSITYPSGLDFDIYLVYDLDPNDSGVSWVDVVDWYDDCTVQGVTDSVADFITPYEDLTSLPTLGSPTTTDGYRKYGGGQINWNFGGYPACETLVQVALQDLNDDGEYNAAWTDRDWYDSGLVRHTLLTDNDNLTYTTLSELMPFGTSINYTELEGLPDPYAPQVLACSDASSGSYYQANEVTGDFYTFEMPNVNLTCDSSDYQISSSTGEQARAFKTFTLSQGLQLSSEYWPTTCGGDTGGDCSSACSTGADPVTECNVGVYCDDSASDPADYVCVGGGPMDGASCADASDTADDEICQVLVCTTRTSCDDNGNNCISSYRCGMETEGYTLVEGSDSSAVDLLKQIFAKAYDLILFTDGYTGIDDADSNEEWSDRGTFCSFMEDPTTCNTDSVSTWLWDERATGDDITDPTPPIVRSVGTCVDTLCYEGDESSVTVNEMTSGNFEGEGEYNVALSFFVYADQEQMPLRQIIVDWGGGEEFTSVGPPWPTDNQSGSTANNNFYKNQRGLGENSNAAECDSQEWGTTTDSCTTGYVNFTNHYSCSNSLLTRLEDRTCTVDEDGNLVTSPCTGGDVTGASGACVFQPRVFAEDNWGWCTGFCDSNPEDDSDGCYGQECNFEACPSGGYDGYACPDIEIGGTADPWVYYDGYIIVTP